MLRPVITQASPSVSASSRPSETSPNSVIRVGATRQADDERAGRERADVEREPGTPSGSTPNSTGLDAEPVEQRARQVRAAVPEARRSRCRAQAGQHRTAERLFAVLPAERDHRHLGAGEDRPHRDRDDEHQHHARLAQRRPAPRRADRVRRRLGGAQRRQQRRPDRDAAPPPRSRPAPGRSGSRSRVAINGPTTKMSSSSGRLERVGGGQLRASVQHDRTTGPAPANRPAGS